MAKGRPRDPGREKRGTGNRPQTGQGKAIVLAPVNEQLADREPPPDLPPAAAEVWSICVREMAGNRHLREPDLVLLKAYAEAAYVHQEASANIHRYGVLVKGPDGRPVTNPMVRVQKDAAQQLRQLSDVLGLNPLARIRGNLLEAAGASLMVDLRDRLVDKLTAKEAKA